MRSVVLAALALSLAPGLRAQPEPALAYPLAPRDFFPEGVAHAALPDAGGRLVHSLYVGSVRYGRIDRVDEATGRQTVWATAPHRWSVGGLATDAGRGVLWAAVAAPPHARFATGARGTGLARFSLCSARLTGFWTVDAVFLSDVAVGPDGTPVVSDGKTGALYRLGPHGLEPLHTSESLHSAQGLAFGDAPGALYVADYTRGVLQLDLASGSLTPSSSRTP